MSIEDTIEVLDSFKDEVDRALKSFQHLLKRIEVDLERVQIVFAELQEVLKKDSLK